MPTLERVDDTPFHPPGAAAAGVTGGMAAPMPPTRCIGVTEVGGRVQREHEADPE